MKYFAVRNVNIDGTLHKAGEELVGVSEARCQHLLGRFVTTDEALKERKQAESVGADESDDSLDSMTVPQLKTMAEELEIDLPSGANKAAIIQAIEAAAE